jgi:hypothetical protein
LRDELDVQVSDFDFPRAGGLGLDAFVAPVDKGADPVRGDIGGESGRAAVAVDADDEQRVDRAGRELDVVAGERWAETAGSGEARRLIWRGLR